MRESTMDKESKKRFIYGAGKFGNLLFLSLIDMGLEIDYFVQSEEPEIKELNGTPVISFETMINMKTNKIVFIAINNQKVINEIGKNIMSKDKESIIYDCSSFINDNLLKRKKYILSSSGEKHCILCGNDVNEFLPAGIEEDIFKQHHIIGGGYRNNCICPCCGSGDRNRWLYYVIKNKTNISNMYGRILHFAPEREIVKYIKENPNIDYYTGDIKPGRAMHVTDITDIQYKDDTFDYVICNHVMEHIPDEEKAVYEIKRVLKQSGKWIFSFPICTDMKTYEDKSITLPDERLKAYGQKDHVRLYGYDFAERFEKFGLRLQIYTPQNELDNMQIDKLGFIKDDIIIIAEKQC